MRLPYPVRFLILIMSSRLMAATSRCPRRQSLWGFQAAGAFNRWAAAFKSCIHVHTSRPTTHRIGPLDLSDPVFQRVQILWFGAMGAFEAIHGHSRYRLYIFPFSLYSMMTRFTYTLGKTTSNVNNPLSIELVLVNLHRDENIAEEYLVSVNANGQVRFYSFFQ